MSMSTSDWVEYIRRHPPVPTWQPYIQSTSTGNTTRLWTSSSAGTGWRDNSNYRYVLRTFDTDDVFMEFLSQQNRDEEVLNDDLIDQMFEFDNEEKVN